MQIHRYYIHGVYFCHGRVYAAKFEIILFKECILKEYLEEKKLIRIRTYSCHDTLSMGAETTDIT